MTSAEASSLGRSLTLPVIVSWQRVGRSAEAGSRGLPELAWIICNVRATKGQLAHLMVAVSGPIIADAFPATVLKEQKNIQIHAE
jgi:hypothetical protein